MKSALMKNDLYKTDWYKIYNILFEYISCYYFHIMFWWLIAKYHTIRPSIYDFSPCQETSYAMDQYSRLNATVLKIKLELIEIIKQIDWDRDS